MIAVIKKPKALTVPSTHQWMEGYFQGQDVFIIGGGPSLTGFDFSRLKDRRVIAINWAFRDCKPDVLVFLDYKFYLEMSAMGYKLNNFPYRVVTTYSHKKSWPANVTTVHQAPGPSLNPCKLFAGASSAYTAINLAMIGRAKRIILLGIDGGFLGGSKEHYYSGKGGKFLRDDKKQLLGYAGDGTFTPESDNIEENFIRMRRGFDKFRGMAEIINCSMESEVKAFPKIPFENIIKEVN